MKQTQTTYKYNDKSDLRVIVYETGERYYVLTDICRCIGYQAPTKFADRCTYVKKKVNVFWKNGIKRGNHWMWAVKYEDYLNIAEHFDFPEDLTSMIRSIETQGKDHPIVSSRTDDVEIEETIQRVEVVRNMDKLPEPTKDTAFFRDIEQTTTESDNVVKNVNLHSEELADLVSNIVLSIIKLMKYANVNQ